MKQRIAVLGAGPMGLAVAYQLARDGHEPGDGVINLVLLAKNATKIWEKIEPIVEGASDELDINAVAFRELDGEEFTVLWPVDYEGEFELA